MNLQNELTHLPEDVSEAIRSTKKAWRESIGDVSALVENIIIKIENEIREIETAQKSD